MLNVILYLSYVGTLYGLIKVIYDMFKRKTLKAILSSHEFSILIASAIIAICFFIPWNKFHYGDEKPKIVRVYLADPPPIKNHPIPPMPTKTDSIINRPKKHRKSITISKQVSKKVDTAKKEAKVDNSIAVQNSPNSHIVGGIGNQVGVNGDVNINTKYHLDDAGLARVFNAVDSLVKNKNFDKNKIVVYTENYSNGTDITDQLVVYFNQRGYHTHGAMAMSGRIIQGILVDTSRIFPNQRQIKILVGRF